MIIDLPTSPKEADSFFKNKDIDPVLADRSAMGWVEQFNLLDNPEAPFNQIVEDKKIELKDALGLYKSWNESRGVQPFASQKYASTERRELNFAKNIPKWNRLFSDDGFESELEERGLKGKYDEVLKLTGEGGQEAVKNNFRRKLFVSEISGEPNDVNQARIAKGLLGIDDPSDDFFILSAKKWVINTVKKQEDVKSAYKAGVRTLASGSDIQKERKKQRKISADAEESFNRAVLFHQKQYSKIFPLARRLVLEKKEEGAIDVLVNEGDVNIGTIAEIYMAKGGREKFLYAIGQVLDAEKEEVDSSTPGKIIKSVGRGADAIMKNIGRKLMRAWSGVSDQPQDNNSNEFWTAVQQVEVDAKDFKSAVSTITSDNVFLQGVYDASQSIPFTLLMANPAGMATMAASFHEQHVEEIKSLDPKVSYNDASRVALFSAPIEVGIERLQFGLLTGKFPGLTAPLSKLAKGSLIGTIAGVTSLEYAQETVQEAVLPVVLDMVNVLKKEMPKGDWEHYKVMDQRRFFAVLPLAVLGGGGQYARNKFNLKEVGEILLDEEGILLSGRTKEQAKKITSLAKTDPEAALALYKKQGSEMSTEEQNTLGNQAMREVYSQQLGEEFAAMPISRKTKNGKFSLDFQDGRKEIYDSEIDRDEALKEWSQEEFFKTREAMEAFAEMAKERTEGDTSFKIQKPQTFQDLYNQGIETKENLQKAIGVFYANMNQVAPNKINLSDYIQEGSVTMKRQFSGFAVRLAQGASPITVAEEFSEGFIRRAVGLGETTFDEIKKLLDEFGLASDINMTEGYDIDPERAIIEGFSKFAKAYALQGKYDMLPEETQSWMSKAWSVMENGNNLSGILKAFSELFSKMFKAVYDVAKAIEFHRAKGAGIDPDLESMALRALGFDEKGYNERMQERANQEALEETFDPSDELFQQVKGKLPNPRLTDVGKYKSDLMRIHDSMVKVTNKKLKSGKRRINNKAADNFFLPKGVDALVEQVMLDLNEQGFDFESESDFLDAVLNSVDYQVTDGTTGSKLFPITLGDTIQGDYTFSISDLTENQANSILEDSKYIAPEEVMWDDSIDGSVVVGAYHGSTNQFEKLKAVKGNVEGNWGSAIYASTEIQDVNENYAGEGADLTSRIEQETESVYQEIMSGLNKEEAKAQAEEMGLDWHKIELDDTYDLTELSAKKRTLAKVIAKQNLVGTAGAQVYPMYIPMKNPAVFAEKGGTFYDPNEFIDFEQYREEALEQVMEEEGLTKDEVEDYLVEDRMRELSDESGDLNPVYEAIEAVSENYNFVNKQFIFESLDTFAIEGGRLSEVEDALRKTDELYNIEDMNGNVAPGNFLRDFFMELGFDGIIDKRVTGKFNMKGMDESTVHIIVPYDTKNRPRSAIDYKSTFSITKKLDAEYMAAVESGDVETQQEMVEAAAKKSGYKTKAYHVTDEEFDEFDPNKSAMGGVFWFTTDKQKISRGKTGAGLRPDKKKKTLSVFLKTEKSAGWNEYDKLGLGQIESRGFDSIKLDDDFVIFDSSQIKLSDAVTRDADGKVIPLSKRFDPNESKLTFAIQPVEQYGAITKLEKKILSDRVNIGKRLEAKLEADEENWNNAKKSGNQEEIERAAQQVMRRTQAYMEVLPNYPMGPTISKAQDLAEKVLVGSIEITEGIKIVDENARYSGLPIKLPSWLSNLKVADWVKRNLRARGDLTPDQFKIKLASEAITLTELKRAELINSRLKKAVKKESLVAPNPEGVLMEDFLMKRVQDALVMDGAVNVTEAINKLPKSLQSVTKEMRVHVDSLSREMIKKGIAKGDLADVFQRNIGSYLNRSYRRFTRPEKWKHEVSEESRKNAMQWLQDNLPAEAFSGDVSKEDQLEGYVDTLLTDSVSGGFTDQMNWLLGQKHIGNLIARKKVPVELRELWGEYKRGDENYMTSVRKMATQIGNHTMLTEFLKNGLNTEIFSTPRKGFSKQISSKGNEMLSPLDGYYVSEGMSQALIDFSETGEKTAWWLKYWLKYNSLSKVTKTIYNPTTHARNFLSNFVYVGANGNLFEYLNIDTVKMSATINYKEIFKSWGTTKDIEDRILHYIRLGIMQQGAVSQEFKDILNDFSAGDVDIDEYTQNSAKRFAKAGLKKIESLYQAEDDFHKIVSYEAERAKLAKAKPKWKSDKLDAEAAQIVRDTMPDYSQVPHAVKMLRRLPFIGTFTSFTSEVIRNNTNIIQRAKFEMSDPELRSIGAKRLSSFAIAHSIPLAGAYYLASLLGVDDEEDEATRAIAAPWDKYAQLLYVGRTPSGDPQYINISYTDPFSVFKTPIFVSQQDGFSPVSVAKGILMGLEPFYGEEIGTAALLDIRENKNEKIYNPNSDAWTITKDISEHILKALEPGLVRSAKRIYEAATGKETDSGMKLDTGTEVIAVLSGQRITSIDRRRAIFYRNNDFQDALRSSTYRFKGAWRNKNVDKKELSKAYKQYKKDNEKAYSEFQDALQAVSRLGLTEEQILLETTKGKDNTETAKRLLNLLRAPAGETPMPDKKFTKSQIKEIEEKGRKEILEEVAPELFD
tara:strand:- start:58 stop:7674 length:7617 start_codon:yes stop_codon:yes gene_type:complete